LINDCDAKVSKIVQELRERAERPKRKLAERKARALIPAARQRRMR